MRREDEATSNRESCRHKLQARMEKSLTECKSRKPARLLASCTSTLFQLSTVMRGVNRLDTAIDRRPMCNWQDLVVNLA